MGNRKATMHVLSHTHWDREWYQDFQGFRQRLVFQIDTMMDLMDRRPEYKYFHLDGQTSCALDYLEIRPECRERLTKFMQEGRVLIGPWFVMPDELLLSGESMVRNLLLGHKICAEFGVEPMPVGYVTDIFGHCSQFPQIVKGFGIDTTLLHRGTSTEDETSEMVWEGADGSEVLLIKVYPYTGYQDFLGYRAASEEIIKEWERRKLDMATTDVLFALDGNDHQPAYTAIPEYIERVNSIFTDIECVHSSMTEYLTALRAALGPNWKEGRKRFKGELRRPNKMGTYAELFYGTASSLVPLKQANDMLEYLLPRCAEPMHAWSVMLGGDDQKPFLNLAWRYLLLNHPHDSIVGCSVDQVHRDMMYRFDQARSIARNSLWESAFAICDRVDTSSFGEDWAVTAFNQATVDAGPVVRFPFYLPTPIVDDKAKQGLVPALLDAGGAPIYFETEKIEHKHGPKPLVKKTHGDSPLYGWLPYFGTPHETYHVAVPRAIPAMGYDTLRIGFIPESQAESVALPKGMTAVQSDEGYRTIENKFISLTANEDGTVNLLDKVARRWYRGLHAIEDCGDAGQGWDHFYPETDTVVRSTDDTVRGPVRIEVAQNGPLSASITVGYAMRVPLDLTPDRKARSERQTFIGIETVYSLDTAAHRIDCRTTIENHAKFHRIRAILPTGIACDTWFGDTAFDLVERDVKLLDTTGWLEQAREESPIKNLVAACDGKSGLAVLTKGLQEACVQDNPERSIALTLFRGFSEELGGEWTEESQLLGKITVEYAIQPFAPEGNRPPVALFREVERYKMPITPISYMAHPGDLPLTDRLMQIDGDVVVSTIKTSEDSGATIVRLFNPSTEQATTSVRSLTPLQGARKADMLEITGEIVPMSDDRSFEVTLRAKEVLNLRLIR